MNKFAQTCCLFLMLFVSSSSHATLITDSSLITSDHYVSVGSLDFAWASPVNVEYWDDYNQLYAPTIHEGWDYATSEELEILFENVTLADFYISDGVYRNAAKFWNSYFEDVVLRFTVGGVEYVDISNLDNFTNKQVKSFWTVGDMDTFGSDFETFYVRRNNQGGGGSVDVPEPTTVMIFGFGLIALALRKKFL
ncbi:PEP-CTERM sorting domain-containing protein [Thalassotalea profundi]|uniref:Ice-binding protein C-terminal domain-containing protein n=1 Tax=Thalassotalea profundi TaxID=2036687 RepID=A0ABQ3J121_9GAMM|nr:PEP-CTERM sorting domain-containing protein [Thalassotalea profundi]GHE99201.1 hypothetical protein GCM10011501_30940 [Thalassotalea profundi]